MGEGEDRGSLRRQSSAGGSGESTRGRLRARLLLGVAALAALLVFDLTRAPQTQWSARALLGAIGIYQATLSPVLGVVGVRCRFVPSCSYYAQDAIRQDGAMIGAARAIWRVARCGPWTPVGTVDPA